MRKFVIAAISGAAMAYAAASPAGAFSLDPTAIRPAVDAINPVDKTACWRWGWHGWGWYRCHPYGYGWAPGWRWHRWHHWY